MLGSLGVLLIVSAFLLVRLAPWRVTPEDMSFARHLGAGVARLGDYLVVFPSPTEPELHEEWHEGYKTFRFEQHISAGSFAVFALVYEDEAQAKQDFAKTIQNSEGKYRPHETLDNAHISLTESGGMLLYADKNVQYMAMCLNSKRENADAFFGSFQSAYPARNANPAKSPSEGN